MADDRAALLRELHDVHAPSLWRFVVRLTGDHRFAEDVVRRPCYGRGDGRRS
jgi:RNA polymerase sigma-70 factor (ECF subfamily)